MPRKIRNPLIPIDNQEVPEKLRWVSKFVEKGILVAAEHGDGREQAWFVRAWILHYLIKKEWSRKHKMPSASTNDQKYMNCVGDIYHQAYKLCVKSFEGEFKYSEEYNHPLIRWVNLLVEASLSEGRRDERVFLFTTPGVTKKMVIESLRNENQKLREFKNPFSPIFESHTWKLIEGARTFAQQTIGEDIFYQDFWQPLLKARGAKFLRAVNSSSCLIPQVGEKLGFVSPDATEA